MDSSTIARSADVGVSLCFFVVLEQPLEFQIFIFSYSVSPFVGFLFPVEEFEDMSLFVLNSNSITRFITLSGMGSGVKDRCCNTHPVFRQ